MRASFLLFLARAWIALLACVASPAWADSVDAAPQRMLLVQDVLGRNVEVRLPMRRMILEESRQLYTVAMLEQGNPLARIVGWGGDLLEADPATYRQYRQRFPEIDRIPVLGRFADASFNLEQAVALAPDVIFLNMETSRLASDSAMLDNLARLGIPVLYVDFRHDPEKNAEHSLRLFGQVLEQDARVEEIIAFRRKEIFRVSSVLSLHRPDAPGVFVERLGGFSEDCCFSFGDGNIGRYVEQAGGRNLAHGIIPGTFGQINPEQVLHMAPEHVVVTSADWGAYRQTGDWIPVGPGSDGERARKVLASYPLKAVYRDTPAARRKRFHAIWHQFYNSPYDFVVIQQLAAWFHPSLFAGLDADDTFRRFHERFLPVPYAPGYFASLDEDKGRQSR